MSFGQTRGIFWYLSHVPIKTLTYLMGQKVSFGPSLHPLSSLCNKAAKAQVSLCKCPGSPMLCWSTIDIKSTTVFIKLTLAIQMLDLWETFIFTGIILAQKLMRELIPFSQK